MNIKTIRRKTQDEKICCNRNDDAHGVLHVRLPEHTGGDDDWSYVMLYGSIKF